MISAKLNPYVNYGDIRTKKGNKIETGKEIRGGIEKEIEKILFWAVILLLFGYFVFYSGAAFAGDELAGVLDEVKANFGKDSAAVTLLYGAEIIAGGYAWHKTKNPAAVTGIVILSLFMNFALGKWIG